MSLKEVFNSLSVSVSVSVSVSGFFSFAGSIYKTLKIPKETIYINIEKLKVEIFTRGRPCKKGYL